MGATKLSILIVLVGFNAFGSETTNSLPVQPVTQSELREVINTDALKEISKKRLSVAIDASYESDLKKRNQVSHEANISVELIPSYKIGENWKASADVIFSKELAGAEKSEVSNALLSVAHNSINIEGGIFEVPSTYNFGAFAYAPTNEEAREKDKYYGGTGVSLGLEMKPKNWGENSQLGYTISLLKNYHEYTRNVERTALLSHRLRHTVTYSQKIAKDLSLELLGRYQTGFTYQNALRTSFVLNEAIAYSIAKNTDVYVYHTNEGSALEADGITSNIDIYDRNHSVIGMGLRGEF